jgi:ankyrin repeat protein
MKSLTPIVFLLFASNFQAMMVSHTISKRAIRKFLVAGNDPNTLDSEGYTLLQLAVLDQNIPCIKYLLKKTLANPNEYSSFGKAAIHIAVSFKQLKALNVLLKNGVDPDFPSTYFNLTPLEQSLSIGNDAECIKILLKYGAQITPKVHQILIERKDAHEGTLHPSAVKLIEETQIR